PNVNLTAFATVCTPLSSAWRASSSKMISFAAILITPSWMEVSSEPQGSADDGENVLFAHDQVFVAIDPDFGSGILAHENLVARLHLEGNALSFIGQPPGTDSHDLRLLRFFLCGIRNDDSTALHFGLLE